jgi:hypothetical protein
MDLPCDSCLLVDKEYQLLVLHDEGVPELATNVQAKLQSSLQLKRENTTQYIKDFGTLSYDVSELLPKW